MNTLGVLRVGDRVVFRGDEHTVVALAGTSVRLVAASGRHSVVLLPYLLSAVDFAVIGVRSPEGFAPLGLLDGVPAEVAERARLWERHLIEVESGHMPDSDSNAAPRPEYDTAHTTLAQREAAKARELTALGVDCKQRTVQRMRRRYREQGVWGLVDQRLVGRNRPTGNIDERVVTATVHVIEAQTPASTGTKARVMGQVRRRVEEEHGAGVVPMPSTSTFYRLLDVLSVGRHTFGSAATRRSSANRPTRPFTPTTAARPGEQVQIDTTPLDVMTVMDDGVVGRAELTIAVDVATRTICAALLHPARPKAVDASLLLARMLVPEPMRPGWSEALRMSASRIPHTRLMSVDQRMEHAAAKPVIAPETIVIDHGKVFVSETFLRACQSLGISVQPAHPGTPTDKSVVERTFSSINTLFCQHVTGYTGRDVTRRGARVDADTVWNVADLQDLLDEWVVAGWQVRPHEGLRHPYAPERILSPNDAYAALVAAAGHVPVVLDRDAYIEMLPAVWRSINDYGVQIDYRTYDSAELNPYRRQPSPMSAKSGKWEIHYDPYDLSRVWVRDHHRDQGWIEAPWVHQGLVNRPFADFTWRYARRLATQRGVDTTNETSLAVVLAALLRRCEDGPGPDQAATARARASTDMPQRPRVPPPTPQDLDEETRDDGDGAEQEVETVAKVIPFEEFNPFEEGDAW
ncbi:transposase [Nocardiopsis terrae]|uniref:Transposase InsO family protein n=1 Tax=Nocardiopsis terrae TaxID=372655 RepID=A0ABR9HH97_9ACTN|nr:Mu transposase C-terminal domain-containing protein [Nocardiopsis terrae]MBE1458306.1 transposase InsO family protein [Nocardiopsis terrae]GHC81212.1 transposase [Nocardiopsis terrae]